MRYCLVHFCLSWIPIKPVWERGLFHVLVGLTVSWVLQNSLALHWSNDLILPLRWYNLELLCSISGFKFVRWFVGKGYSWSYPDFEESGNKIWNHTHKHSDDWGVEVKYQVAFFFLDDCRMRLSLLCWFTNFHSVHRILLDCPVGAMQFGTTRLINCMLSYLLYSCSHCLTASVY